MTFARQVAEAILNDAQSGMAVWDELNGPEARLSQVDDDKFVITIPQEYDERGNQTGNVCEIVVMGVTSMSFGGLSGDHTKDT